MLVEGRVTDLQGKPITGALLDVWQANEEGFYDVQQKGIQPDMNLRGIFTPTPTAPIPSARPSRKYYPIPDDGPVGKMLAALGRHSFRPAHIHFIVGAEGFHPITTHYFVPGDPYLESDAVFGVKESLIVEFRKWTIPPRSPDEASTDRIGRPSAISSWQGVKIERGRRVSRLPSLQAAIRPPPQRRGAAEAAQKMMPWVIR